MKRATFNIAKALKEAGYPQGYKNVVEDTYLDLNNRTWVVKPTYDDVFYTIFCAETGVLCVIAAEKITKIFRRETFNNKK